MNSMWGDNLSPPEVARMDVVLRDLDAVEGAQPLLRSIRQRGGVSLQAQPELFEARVAHELWRHGVPFEYEYRTGVGGDSVDFFLPGPPAVLLEVVSLRASEGVRNALWEDGSWTGFSLSSHNLLPGGGDPRESIESELLLLQSKLGEKVYSDGRAHKFPEPTGDTLHVLVMDIRSLFGGREDISAVDEELSIAVHGKALGDPTTGAPGPFGVYLPGGQRLLGIFEPSGKHPLAAATHLRERIHAVHFVYESAYREGEISTPHPPGASLLFNNPGLVPSSESWERLIAAYPLFRPGQ